MVFTKLKCFINVLVNLKLAPENITNIIVLIIALDIIRTPLALSRNFHYTIYTAPNNSLLRSFKHTSGTI